MIGLFIVLAMALGVGGTAVVSDSARPGDALFGVDRAVENARLSLSGEEKKNELRIRFAEERLEEVKEIKAESEVETGDEGEDSREKDEESEAEIKMGLEAALNLITDVNKSGEAEDPRLTALAAALSAYMNALPEDARVEISDDKFRIKFDQGPEKIEIKEQGDNKTKIDVRNEEGRFKIEIKDGQIEIKTKTKTKTEDDDDDEGDDSKDELEAEAKIFSDKTVIEVEIKDQKTTFSSTATTEADIVAAIVARFPELTSAQVSDVLEIETEDEDDGDENDDEEDEEDEADEKDEDEDDEDEDEKEEDRSGSSSDNE